jgi:hypothetical protein
MLSKNTIHNLINLPAYVNSTPPSKRKEENLKVTLNWVFHKLKEPFLETHQEMDRAQQKFYEHYFSETAESLGLDLRRFNKPNFSQGSKSGPKTLNKNYVYAISKSKQFMKDLTKALRRDFESEMRASITKQVSVMVDKWDAQLENSGNRKQVLKTIHDQVLETVKLKLTWSIKEMINAKEHTVETLASYR